MAARPSWEGFLTLNLISIPIKAYSAAISGGGKIGFHMLHAKCNSRIRYKKVCPIHGEVPNDEIVSGYEYAKGEYVTVQAGEKSKLKAQDDKAIAIDTFVAPDSIDPIYYSGRTYYLVPNGPAAQKPYMVLMEAMSSHDRYAIAQVVLSGKGQVAIVRPFSGILVMTMLSFEAEVKQPDAFTDEIGATTVSSEEKRLAASLLESATTEEVELSRYKDDYAAKLAKLIEKKSHGASVSKPAEAGHPVMDLMDALRQSLSHQKGKARKRTAKGATAGRRRKKSHNSRLAAAA